MPQLISKTRRGFTMAELLVAMVMFAVVGMSLFKVLTNSQRAFDFQTQSMDLQQNLRDAAALIPNELRELDAVDGDIIAMSADSITIRSMRQMGIMCTVPVLGTVPPLLAKTFTVRPMVSEVRPLAVGDSVMFYYEGNPSVRSDDGWVVGKVTAIAGALVRCPGDPVVAGNITATTYTVDMATPASNVVGTITVGSPVRGYQLLTYKKYLAPDGKYYLAIVPKNAGTPQPIIGPLASSTGLAFSYYDRTTGALIALPAAATTAVGQIRIALKAATPKAVQLRTGTAPATDSIALTVALRNNARW
jgi:prepilin-type N-terminal cleavage/methylation domain-containing protein